MYPRFLLPVIFCLAFLVPSAFGQEKSCIITLKNGNTLTANSCRVKGGRIYLKYKLGEASFDLAQVKSITAEDGSTDFLQDKAKSQAAQRQNSNVGPSFSPPSQAVSPPKEAAKQPTEPSVPAQPEEDPKFEAEKEKKFNDFFEKYWQADEEEQAEMDKQMDKVFSDYFNTGETDKFQDE